MTKDEKWERQNLLNNTRVVQAVADFQAIPVIFWENAYYLTRFMAARYFEVNIRTIDRCISQNREELESNGYRMLQGDTLKSFCEAAEAAGEKVSTKSAKMGIFDFRSFLNIGLLLRRSSRASYLRRIMLDMAIELVNQGTGGRAKYINQNDPDYVVAFTMQESYHKRLIDALAANVVNGENLIEHYMDLIYHSIFREKADEYRSILELAINEPVHNTFYADVLHLIAAYESGLVSALDADSSNKGRLLSEPESEEVFEQIAAQPHWTPLIERARRTMASRDLALRNTTHEKLRPYIEPLPADDYDRFLGGKEFELEQLLQANEDVLRRLKEGN